MRYRPLAALAVVAACGAGAAAAQDSAWSVNCDAGGCRMGQVVQANGAVVARVMVLQLQEVEIVEILYPLGVSMLSPPFLDVDGETRLEIRTAACKPNGCYGVVPDAAAAVAAFQRGAEMKLRFTGFDDGQTYFYPFTLTGFTAAYDRYRSGP